MEKKIIASLVGISKRFPGVKAIDNVSVDFYSGEVHVLLGENGAGKSTLIKILAGVYTCDQGEVYLDKQKVQWRDSRDALKHGISVIHQELSVINDLNVAENIFLGREPHLKNGMINKKKMYIDSVEILKSLNLDINAKTLVRYLSSAEKQMIEIARAVSHKSKIVIMDEPTSSLSEKEVKSLFEMIIRLKHEGVSIIYISHRMSEIKLIGDRITILKDGAKVKTINVKDSNESDWIPLMVGRKLRQFIAQSYCQLDTVVLQVEGYTIKSKFEDICFNLHRGEILGIAGLVGAGRTELVRSIFGAEIADSGVMTINGKRARIRSVRNAIDLSIGLVPEDRRAQGLLLNKDIIENISLPNLEKWSWRGWLNNKIEKASAIEYINKLMIKTPNENEITGNLSGGNQQKVILAKWLAGECRILILDEPTRGIDVNAKNEIYHLMTDFVSKGGSIVVISSELPEVIGVSDRIIVMREGKISGELQRGETSEEAIMHLANIN